MFDSKPKTQMFKMSSKSRFNNENELMHNTFIEEGHIRRGEQANARSDRPLWLSYFFLHLLWFTSNAERNTWSSESQMGANKGNHQLSSITCKNQSKIEKINKMGKSATQNREPYVCGLKKASKEKQNRCLHETPSWSSEDLNGGLRRGRLIFCLGFFLDTVIV